MPILESAEAHTSNMIERLDLWIKKYPSLDGMAVGAAAGSVLGPLGTVGGAIVGSSIGHTVGEEARGK